MLRAEGDLFLDNVSVEDVEKALNVRVTVVEKGGYALFDAFFRKD